MRLTIDILCVCAAIIGTRSELVSFIQRGVHTRRTRIGYSMEYLASGDASYLLDLQDSTIAVNVNAKSGALTINASNVVLNDEQRSALRSLAQNAKKDLSSPTLASGPELLPAMRNASAVMKLANYIAACPEGMELASVTLKPDGVDCLSLGSTATAEWHDISGEKRTEEMVVGSSIDYRGSAGDYRCMGICGGGCAGITYTQDCLNHDVCSFYHHSDQHNQLLLDKDCGEEWIEAMDDFVYGCPPPGHPLIEGMRQLFGF